MHVSLRKELLEERGLRIYSVCEYPEERDGITRRESLKGYYFLRELGVKGDEVTVIAHDCHVAYAIMIKIANRIHGNGHVGGVLRCCETIVLNALHGDRKISKGVAGPYLPQVCMVCPYIEIQFGGLGQSIGGPSVNQQ